MCIQYKFTLQVQSKHTKIFKKKKKSSNQVSELEEKMGGGGEGKSLNQKYCS